MSALSCQTLDRVYHRPKSIMALEPQTPLVIPRPSLKAYHPGNHTNTNTKPNTHTWLVGPADLNSGLPPPYDLYSICHVKKGMHDFA